MIRGEESIEINRPPEEVFFYASNPENFPEWVATVIEVRQERPGGGSPLREGGRLMAMQQALVVDLRPLSRSSTMSQTGATPIGVGKDIRWRLQ